MRDLAGAVTTTSRSSRNDDYKDRFKILLDRGWSMNDNTDGALVAGQRVSGPYPSSIRYYIPLNGLLTKYIADAASYLRLDQEHYGAHGSQCCCRYKSHSHYGRKAYIFWLLKYLINFSFKTLSRLFWGALQSLDIIKNCSKPLNDRCGAADGS